MFSCCGHCRWCGVALVAAAGVAAGILGTRALDLEPARPVAAVDAASFQPEMDPEAMMKMMRDWAAPAEQHALLKDMVGTWDCTASFSMGPGEPMVSKGESVAEVVLGGRYVTQHFMMPDFMGEPFEGMGAIGFDKAKGKYVNVWIDSMSTGFMFMEGEFDKAAKTMTWTGTATTPMGEMPAKHVVKHITADKMVMEFWEPNPETGEFSKGGEIVYERRK